MQFEKIKMINLYHNCELFSDHYLRESLLREDNWMVDPKSTYESLKKLWVEVKHGIQDFSEPQLRKHFLDKVFSILGFTVDVEVPVHSGEWAKHPDYALFENNENLKAAQELKKGSKEEYFSRAISICEAKRWGRPLGRKVKTKTDPENPAIQISRYLWLTEVKWGILTDGRLWRLYERETSKKLDIYYEIDLPNLLDSGTQKDFNYFYFIFRAAAFPSFLNKLHQGSIDYAEKVGDELKNNIYEALKISAQGFLKTPNNNLTSENLSEIHDNSLILLYRLLFILYAEYRRLLPLNENETYANSYSFDSLKKEIAEEVDKDRDIPFSTFRYWDRLRELFEVINSGNSELSVPSYNGGLFNPQKHHFLEKYRFGDSYLAKIIDLLSRSSDKAYIDYGSLEVRHLGSIYEGLLEYRLKVNDTGDIQLITDKGERKATGSYYTPDYIVSYIVKNTISPLIEEKKKKVQEEVKKMQKKIKTSRGYNREAYEKKLIAVKDTLIDEILSIKVLDPAMGSGHFLVEATDFLANALIETLETEPLKEEKLPVPDEKPSSYIEEKEEIRWARREVVERCIFGVDLNPLAVELAKLSLWLHTIVKGKPLNFLDHHLKCGNSLIGTKIENLYPLKEEILPASTKTKLIQDLSHAVGAYQSIEETPSNKVSEIQDKGYILENLNNLFLSRWKGLANLWISSHFGNEVYPNQFQLLYQSKEGMEGVMSKKILKRIDKFAKPKTPFHWELEFPEIFFDKFGRPLENPGFDAVIGNPPYIEVKKILDDEKKYLRMSSKHNGKEILHGRYDIFWGFYKKGMDLLKENCILGLLTSNSFLEAVTAENLRKFLVKDNTFLELVDCGKFSKEVGVYVVISLIKKNLIHLETASAQ